MSKKRLGQLFILAGALTVFYFLSRSWPKDQTVRFSFGDASSRVEGLRLVYGDRGAQYRFPPGKAPRTFTSEVRLPDGDYAVEAEVTAHGATKTTTRTAHLESGSTTTVDLSRDVPE